MSQDGIAGIMDVADIMQRHRPHRQSDIVDNGGPDIVWQSIHSKWNINTPPTFNNCTIYKESIRLTIIASLASLTFIM